MNTPYFYLLFILCNMIYGIKSLAVENNEIHIEGEIQQNDSFEKLNKMITEYKNNYQEYRNLFFFTQNRSILEEIDISKHKKFPLKKIDLLEIINAVKDEEYTHASKKCNNYFNLYQNARNAKILLLCSYSFFRSIEQKNNEIQLINSIENKINSLQYDKNPILIKAKSYVLLSMAKLGKYEINEQKKSLSKEKTNTLNKLNVLIKTLKLVSEKKYKHALIFINKEIEEQNNNDILDGYIEITKARIYALILDYPKSIALFNNFLNRSQSRNNLLRLSAQIELSYIYYLTNEYYKSINLYKKFMSNLSLSSREYIPQKNLNFMMIDIITKNKREIKINHELINNIKSYINTDTFAINELLKSEKTKEFDEQSSHRMLNGLKLITNDYGIKDNDLQKLDKITTDFIKIKEEASDLKEKSDTYFNQREKKELIEIKDIEQKIVSEKINQEKNHIDIFNQNSEDAHFIWKKEKNSYIDTKIYNEIKSKINHYKTILITKENIDLLSLLSHFEKIKELFLHAIQNHKLAINHSSNDYEYINKIRNMETVISSTNKDINEIKINLEKISAIKTNSLIENKKTIILQEKIKNSEEKIQEYYKNTVKLKLSWKMVAVSNALDRIKEQASIHQLHYMSKKYDEIQKYQENEQEIIEERKKLLESLFYFN